MTKLFTWTLRALLVTVAALFLGSCLVAWDDGHLYWVPVVYPYEDAPSIVYADADCHYDSWARSYVWQSEATVIDPDGSYDVIAVEAQVYDGYHGGDLVESFPLDPTWDPDYWWAEWSVPWLSCSYSGYSIDIVAWDHTGLSDWVSVYP